MGLGAGFVSAFGRPDHCYTNLLTPVTALSSREVDLLPASQAHSIFAEALARPCPLDLALRASHCESSYSSMMDVHAVLGVITVLALLLLNDYVSSGR